MINAQVGLDRTGNEVYRSGQLANPLLVTLAIETSFSFLPVPECAHETSFRLVSLG
jgi:hypothetical protein